MRIEFLNTFRAIAALLVLYAHLFVRFWSNPKGASDVARTVPIGDSIISTKLNLLDIFLSKFFSTSEFGVAIFFLISGFVISLSLSKAKPNQFLVARIFRIYPVIVSVLLFDFIYMNVYHYFVGIPLDIPFKDFLINMSLAREFYWQVPVEFAIWSLEVEIKFYILMAVLYAFLKTEKQEYTKYILLISTFMLVFNFMTSGTINLANGDYLYLYKFFVVWSQNFPFIIFMFIGVMFYYLYSDKITFIFFIFAVSLLLLLFCYSSWWSLNETLRHHVKSYLFAFVFFGIAYMLKNFSFWGRSKVFNFFADISFPLYLIHGMLGFHLQTIFYNQGCSTYIATALSCLIIVLVSYIFHIMIENPFHKFGKKFAKKI